DEQLALRNALKLTRLNTNNGTINWTYSNADGALDFLATNQTVKVTSTVTLDDHQPGLTDTATITITIAGSNDAPKVDAVAAGTLTDTSAPDTFANLTGQLVGHDADNGETASLS